MNAVRYVTGLPVFFCLFLFDVLLLAFCVALVGLVVISMIGPDFPLSWRFAQRMWLR